MKITQMIDADWPSVIYRKNRVLYDVFRPSANHPPGRRDGLFLPSFSPFASASYPPSTFHIGDSLIVE